MGNGVRAGIFSIIALLAVGISQADTTGIVEGTVSYKPDAARPWRYSRFYLKTRGTGLLSEAVVALQGAELRKAAIARKPLRVDVDQRDFSFIPETSAIHVGDTVRFLNNDGPTHNVRAAQDIASFNENMPAGGEYLHVFKKPTGINNPIAIGCVYHGNMRAWIYVFDNPHFHITDGGGKFRFENVPVGSFQLNIAHPAGQLKLSQRVTVMANEITRVSVELTPEQLVK